MRGRQPYDNDGVGREEYSDMLKVSIEDTCYVLNQLIDLEESSWRRRISGRDMKAIRFCACFARGNIDMHIKPVK